MMHSFLWGFDQQGTLLDILAANNTKVKEIVNDRFDRDEFGENIGKVTIYFQHFNHQNIWEEPLYVVCILAPPTSIPQLL